MTSMQTMNRLNQPAEYKGMTLPKAARDLLFEAHGDHWLTGWLWAADNGGSSFVTVHVADRETKEYFKYTWHSRGTGTLRLFSKLHRPPNKDVWVDGPSLKAVLHRVREVIHQNS